jgi:hypothetical protein
MHQASRVDETIREHAREARSFLHERVSEQLLTIPEVDEETTGTALIQRLAVSVFGIPLTMDTRVP